MSTSQPTVAASSFTFNYDEAVRAMFRDPDWLKKVLLGSLFSILGIFVVGSIIVQGYLIVYAERVARADPRPLPEWEDYGELLKKGLIGLLVSIVYSLPLILVAILFVVLMIPLSVAAGAAGASGDAIGGIFTLALCGGMAVFLPISIAVYLIYPASFVQLILHNHDLGAAFRVGDVLRLMRRHLGQYLVMVLLSYAAVFGLSQVGQIACFIGIFPAVFLSQLFQYHLIGQLCWYERNVVGQSPVVP